MTLLASFRVLWGSPSPSPSCDFFLSKISKSCITSRYGCFDFFMENSHHYIYHHSIEKKAIISIVLSEKIPTCNSGKLASLNPRNSDRFTKYFFLTDEKDGLTIYQSFKRLIRHSETAASGTK